jgi:long-subunit acyl-CoA synthetase (AMP-forming)
VADPPHRQGRCRLTTTEVERAERALAAAKAAADEDRDRVMYWMFTRVEWMYSRLSRREKAAFMRSLTHEADPRPMR